MSAPFLEGIILGVAFQSAMLFLAVILTEYRAEHDLRRRLDRAEQEATR